MARAIRHVFRMAEPLPSERGRIVAPTFAGTSQMGLVSFAQAATAPPVQVAIGGRDQVEAKSVAEMSAAGPQTYGPGSALEGAVALVDQGLVSW